MQEYVYIPSPEARLDERRNITYDDLFKDRPLSEWHTLDIDQVNAEVMLQWLLSTEDYQLSDMGSRYWLHRQIDLTVRGLRPGDAWSEYQTSYDTLMQNVGERLVAEFPPLAGLIANPQEGEERPLSELELLMRSGALRADIMQRYGTDPLAQLYDDESFEVRQTYKRGMQRIEEDRAPAKQDVSRPSLQYAEDLLNVCVRELNPVATQRYQLLIEQSGELGLRTNGQPAKLCSWDGIDHGPTSHGDINLGKQEMNERNLASAAIGAILYQGYGVHEMCRDPKELAEVIFQLNYPSTGAATKLSRLFDIRERVGLDMHARRPVAVEPPVLQRRIDMDTEVTATPSPYESLTIKTAAGRMIIDRSSLVPEGADYVIPGVLTHTNGEDVKWEDADPYVIKDLAFDVEADDVIRIAQQLEGLGLEAMSEAFVQSVQGSKLSLEGMLRAVGASADYHYNVGAQGESAHIGDFSTFIRNGRLLGNCSVQAEFGAALLRGLRIPARALQGYAVNAAGRPTMPHAQIVIMPAGGADYRIVDPTRYDLRNLGPDVPAELQVGNIVPQEKLSRVTRIMRALSAYSAAGRQSAPAKQAGHGDDYDIKTLVAESITDTFVARWQQWLERNFMDIPVGSSRMNDDLLREHMARAVLAGTDESSLVRRVYRLVSMSQQGKVPELRAELNHVRQAIYGLRRSYGHGATSAQIAARQKVWHLPRPQLDALEDVLSALPWYR